MTSEVPAITIRSLVKRFRRTSVLNDLSFTVRTGETFALLGRNGAGKTTTIRMLMGLLRPDVGSISVLGLDPMLRAEEIRRRVGYLAEDQGMFGWMRVEQIIAFMAPFYPRWDARLATDLVDRFQLARSRRVKHLSKGERVRLGLLLALAHRPELVLLDDPVLGLDPVMRKEFNRDLITHLQGDGRTVVYSSHLLHEVETVADTIAILHGGRIVAHGPAETLRDHVKRVIIPGDAYDRLDAPLEALDVSRHDGEVAITVADADAARAALARATVAHRWVDLNLDEIFEAYVAGRPAHASSPPAAARETVA